MWLKFLALGDLLIGCHCDPKHFLVIIADDFGWGDVSMHGTGGMLKLLFFFRILNVYYNEMKSFFLDST